MSVRQVQPGRKRATTRREAVLFLSGGPGQATTPTAGELVPVLRPLLKGRDLLTVDTRGTGRSSDLIVCPELETTAVTALSSSDLVASCARRFGGATDRYGTADVVADLDAVRQAEGYDRLVVVGVSYGTFTAQRYAAAYPGRVTRLVLDSSVDPTGDDPYTLATVRAAPTALARACRRGACRGVTADPRADLARTLARLPLTARVDGGNGHRVRTTITGNEILSLVLGGDFDATIRPVLVGALRRAADGDGAPLARLAREYGVVLPTGDDDDPTATAGTAGLLSQGAFVATTCRDTRLPWGPGSTPDARRAAALAQLAAVPPAARAGFSPADLVTFTAAGLCVDWPGSPDPTPMGPLPDVPTLVLGGADDTRTSPEEAARVASRFRRAAHVTVPDAGHSVLTADAPCVTRALRAFAAGGRVPACPRPEAPRPVPAAPPAGARGLGRDPAARARAVAAATVGDAARSLALRVLTSADIDVSEEEQTVRVAGLRSGTAVTTGDGDLRLEAFGFVPGTAVSGVLGSSRRVRVRVRGAGVRPGVVRVANPFHDEDALYASLGFSPEEIEGLSARSRAAVRRLVRR
nr:alpha/beta fold hydrolase [Patulibacter sp. SYSU D01012]